VDEAFARWVTYAATEHLGCGALRLLRDARPVGTRLDLSGRLIGDLRSTSGALAVPYGRWEVTDVTEGFELAFGCLEFQALLAVVGYFLLGRGASRAAHTPAGALVTLRLAVLA